MNVQELTVAAQSLTFEQRKELIKSLFAQQPKPNAEGASILWVGDLAAGTEEIRQQVSASLERSARELCADDAEP
ncbi:MAG: hypothetical protein HOP19_06965 [Acidobacteria bacterium]|nr:hypothetical protein [Acidobacteriota bacterium]